VVAKAGWRGSRSDPPAESAWIGTAELRNNPVATGAITHVIRNVFAAFTDLDGTTVRVPVQDGDRHEDDGDALNVRFGHRNAN